MQGLTQHLLAEFLLDHSEKLGQRCSQLYASGHREVLSLRAKSASELSHALLIIKGTQLPGRREPMTLLVSWCSWQRAPLLLNGARLVILPLLTSTTLSISCSLAVFKLKLQSRGSGSLNETIKFLKRRTDMW